MKYLLFFLIAITFGFNNYAQQVDYLKGRVVDEDGNPVRYANVGIYDTQIGTATNEQGEFSLNISTAPENGLLVISAISHKSYKVRLAQITTPHQMEVVLPAHYFVMNEIEVSALNQNVEHIIQKALINWHNNYTRDRYQLKGFYRELLRNDEEYVSLVEAAFTMQDRGYHKSQDKRFRLDALRKSDDLREMDSLDIYYDQVMSDNGLEGLFHRDYIDAFNSKYSFFFWPNFNDQFIKNFDFLLDSMAYYNGKPVYCISFFTKRKKKFSNHYYEYNQLVINQEDYAVIEMKVRTRPREVTETEGDKRGNITSLADGENWINLTLRYQAYKGHWYPYLITQYRAVVGGDKQKASRLAFEKLRAGETEKLEFDNVEYNGRKLDPDKNNYYRHQQLLITHVSDKKDGFKNIKNRELMDSDTYIRDIEMSYDADFWKGFNKILVNPHLKAAKKYLEEDKSLEEQFVSNGLK